MKDNITSAITLHLKTQECMGCSACINICPRQALVFDTDEYGYYIPVLDETKCIDCGLCQKTCPALHLPEKTNASAPTLYKFIAKDRDLRIRSSSGGVFSLLAECILKNNGAVAGCAWRDDFTAGHILIDKKEDLHKLRKSKYMQSYMGDVFRETKQRLEQGQQVLFTACPCQIAGLKAFLHKDYENLFLVDLLCSHSPSAGFFKKYMDEQFPDGLKSYEFRNKTQGSWGGYTVLITEKDNRIRSIPKKDDPYMIAFPSHLMTSEHCEHCRFQSLPRYGDLTIGDFWGIERREPGDQNQLGVSVVLCNNEKGKKLLDMLPATQIGVMEDKPLAWLGGNGSALQGKQNWASPNRDKFYSAIQRMPFSKAVEYALKAEHLTSDNPDEKRSRLPLHYDSSSLHFIFDPNQWEEHYVLRKTVLVPKNAKPMPKQFAMLPLLRTLEKGKKYKFQIRFKVSSDANELNFHVMNSVSRELQIIHNHKIQPEDCEKWQTVNAVFTAKHDTDDVFSIGAIQVSGENRWLAIDHIKIEQCT